jgi:hypothetical protein
MTSPKHRARNKRGKGSLSPAAEPDPRQEATILSPKSVRQACLDALQASLEVGHHLRSAIHRMGDVELVWRDDGPIRETRPDEDHDRALGKLLEAQEMVWQNTGRLIVSTAPPIGISSESFRPAKH